MLSGSPLPSTFHPRLSDEKDKLRSVATQLPREEERERLFVHSGGVTSRARSKATAAAAAAAAFLSREFTHGHREGSEGARRLFKVPPPAPRPCPVVRNRLQCQKQFISPKSEHVTLSVPRDIIKAMLATLPCRYVNVEPAE